MGLLEGGFGLDYIPTGLLLYVAGWQGGRVAG